MWYNNGTMKTDKTNAAAILLCAGKGTRMCDNSRNKVAFDCAGEPVIKRIVRNMRAGGVSRFVVVVGHLAESVMTALDGETGVVYAYQKEQKGTGHAAQCGLNVLRDIGYDGPVIISMGDKIVAPGVVASLLAKAGSSKAVLGVQPRSANPGGGLVIFADAAPCGIVEFADAAFMSLALVAPHERMRKLKELGVSGVKASKILDRAARKEPSREITVAAHVFDVEEILKTPYANTALYCFDSKSLSSALAKCGSDNAQGEIYLTDVIEVFASSGDVDYYEVTNSADLLTYSDRRGLRSMSRMFLRRASEMLAAIDRGEMDGVFAGLYPEHDVERQRNRYKKIVSAFIDTYSDREICISRAPGRVNLMGRHIEHRGGGVNVFATGCDTVIVASQRDDDRVNIADVEPGYPPVGFSIKEELSLGSGDSWSDYLSSPAVREALAASRGHWSNYVKSAALRFQMACDFDLCGMDIVCGGEVPVAAGLSSSSSLVVAVAEVLVSLNSLNITESEFVDLCGEGEWFVGSRGGAGDHAAIKCGKKDAITHLDFKPFSVGKSVKFDPAYAVIVANSLEQAKKSEGAKDKFNAQVASYEFAFMLIKRAFPENTFSVFRDLAEIRPFSRMYKMLKALPQEVSRSQLRALLPESGERVDEIFSTHADPGVYRLREVALYGISECVRSSRFMEVLESGDYAALGAMMKTSHDGDRLGQSRVTDDDLDAWASSEDDVAAKSGAYACSTPRIDAMCDLLNCAPGVFGSQLVGAGLGGSVVALVEKNAAQNVISLLNEKYYEANGLVPSAALFSPSCGSCVLY